MFRITQEALLAAKQRLVDEKVSPLKTPSNSEYHYLSELGENDIYLKLEFIHYCKPVVEYKAEGHYNSTLGNNNQGSTTYKSTVYVGDLSGYVVRESENWQSIPQKHLSTIPSQVSTCKFNSRDVDHFIIQDATPKLRGKIRRGGDPIKAEDLYSIEVISKQEPTRAVQHGVEWAHIIRRDNGEIIGEAYCYNNDPPVFDFVCDESKLALDHSLSQATLAAQKEAAREADRAEKQKKAEAAKAKKEAEAAKKKVAKNKKPKRSLIDVFAQVVVGLIIAAILLAAEFVVILIANKGVIDKVEPGLYSIDVKNWDDYVYFTGSNHTNQYREKIKEGKKRTTSGLFAGYEPGEVPLLAVSPRASKFYIFDISETRGKIPKFQISDLYIKVKVTYSFNGVEDYVIEEKYIGALSSSSRFIEVSLPPESIQASSFMGEPTGSYYADLDYWYFEIIEISGTIEVKEGTGK